MKQNKETLKQFFETGDKPTQQQYADLIDSYIDAKQPEGEVNRRFVIDETGEVSVASEQQVPEYTLSPISGTNTVDLLKDGVSVSQIDLTPYLDNTNLARLVSGTVDANGLATFTRDDNSTFTVDLSNLKDAQVQADFNQTDSTQPDYIKGHPITVYNKDGVKQFEGKELQFDENFEFNTAENEIKLNSQYLQLKTGYWGINFSNGVNSSTISAESSDPISFSSYDLGKFFYNPITYGDSTIYFHLKNYYGFNFGMADQGGTIYPSSAKVKGYLIPKNFKMIWNTSLDRVLVFEQDLNEGDYNTNFLIDVVIKGARNSLIGDVSSNYIALTPKKYDSYGNVVGQLPTNNYQLRTLDDQPILLEECEFYYWYHVTMNFEDADNINGENRNFNARATNYFLRNEIFK